MHAKQSCFWMKHPLHERIGWQCFVIKSLSHAMRRPKDSECQGPGIFSLGHPNPKCHHSQPKQCNHQQLANQPPLRQIHTHTSSLVISCTSAQCRADRRKKQQLRILTTASLSVSVVSAQWSSCTHAAASTVVGEAKAAGRSSAAGACAKMHC